MRYVEKKKRVLVVDDNIDYIGLETAIFRDCDLTVIPAASAYEAMKLLNDAEFDLIITDFNMPGMNGLELIEWCREKNKSMPVLLATSEHEKFSEQDLKLGNRAACIIHKPFSIDSFRKTALGLI